MFKLRLRSVSPTTQRWPASEMATAPERREERSVPTGRGVNEKEKGAKKLGRKGKASPGPDAGTGLQGKPPARRGEEEEAAPRRRLPEGQRLWPT